MKKMRKQEAKFGTSKEYNSGYDAAKSTIKEEGDILYSVKDIKDLAKDYGFEGKDAEKFVKGYQAYADDWYDCHDEKDESVKAKAKKLLKALNENSLTSDEIYVVIVIPDGYFDEYGNPNGEINGMQERLDEIEDIFEKVGAQTKWDVYSSPEDGPEADDFQDTGIRICTVAQLRQALDMGVTEDEIKVYSSIKEEDDYTDADWDIINDPYSDGDINEENRIYDINALVYDADEPMTEAKVKERSGWKKHVSTTDRLDRREDLRDIYNQCHWEFLDSFDDDRYDADADYDPDGNVLNSSDLNDCLCEVGWIFSGTADLADFLRECARENFPKAVERIRHLNKLLGID